MAYTGGYDYCFTFTAVFVSSTAEFSDAFSFAVADAWAEAWALARGSAFVSFSFLTGFVFFTDVSVVGVPPSATSSLVPFGNNAEFSLACSRADSLACDAATGL